MTDKRNEQKQKLLRAAYDLVAEVGISGLRTRDIAERAGVNIATLHYCFAGKDALLEALYDFIVERFRTRFQEKLDAAKTPLETMRAYADFRVELLQDDLTPLRVWRAFVGEAWTNSAIREIVRRHMAESRERMATVISQGFAENAFSGLPTRDPHLAASMILALFDGMLFQYAMDPEAFGIEAYEAAILTWLGMSESARSNATISVAGESL
jgi:AcrR family transcriptional regulator